jgi:hypothetical protein
LSISTDSIFLATDGSVVVVDGGAWVELLSGTITILVRFLFAASPNAFTSSSAVLVSVGLVAGRSGALSGISTRWFG